MFCACWGASWQPEAKIGGDDDVTKLAPASRTFAQTRKEREGTTA
jgi:hypothetical protein